MKFTALLLLIACALPLVARAEEPVPIEQEPRHALKFEIAHVRYFDIRLK